MAFANLRSVPDYRSMELSIKFKTVKSALPILYIEGFHKNITFPPLEIEFVIEYSVDPDEKSFVQYFLWVFTVCLSPRLLQSLNNFVSQQYASLKRLYHF